MLYFLCYLFDKYPNDKIFIPLVCGGNYSGNSGEIYSPHWPNRYPSPSRCRYTINVPAGFVVELKITFFDLSYSHDYIQVCQFPKHLYCYCIFMKLVYNMCGGLEKGQIIAQLFIERMTDKVKSLSSIRSTPKVLDIIIVVQFAPKKKNIGRELLNSQ